MAEDAKPGDANTGMSAAETQGETPFDQLQNVSRCGFFGYFVATFLSAAACSALTIVLWSRMGIGKDALDWLEDKSWLYAFPFCLMMILLFVLYLLDAFWPPHIPGQNFVLYNHDRFLAKGIFAIAFILFMLGNFLMAEWYPNIPMLSTIFLIPISVGLVRIALKPNIKVDRDSHILKEADVHTKMKVLANLAGLDDDINNFYKAACLAFFVTFLVTLIVWIVWIVSEDRLKPMDQEESTRDKEVYFNQFACPLVVALSNGVFALFCTVRVFMQGAYLATDTFKNELIVDSAQQVAKRTSLHQDMDKFNEVVKKARQSVTGVDDFKDAESMKNRYLAKTEQSMKTLGVFVKISGCALMVLIGLLYVATQLLYADSNIASMVMGLMGAFFLIFVAFVFVAFKRIADSMGKWLADLPIWKQVGAIAKSDWTYAFCLCTLMPFIPMILALSCLNQCVRKCRGIAGQAAMRASQNEDGTDRVQPRPETLCLTPRVWKVGQKIMRADILSLTSKCYIFCALYFCYTVVPLLLNATLSWTVQQLAEWNFAVILVMTFLIGVVAFLLPPVPGMTVYIFGGLIVTETCPAGFAWGAVINIGLCWFLKLAACAVQQKCIGGTLGQSVKIRQTVGVHKVSIRCIEAEMRKPGLSFGKVAILCGGPDWPVSVLAGVLGLSLLQCEIGTIPIIFFVAPCALTGSFYLKKGTSEIWTRLANMMIVTSVVVNLILWALAAWAIQNQLENNHAELTRPLPQNVELEWLDHKAIEIQKRIRIFWKDVPSFIGILYVLGAFTHIWVGQAFFWGYNYLFGDFQVSDHIDTLVWYGTDGLFTFLAVLVLAAYGAGWIGNIIFSCWKSSTVAKPRKAAAKDLDGQEASWKEEWLMNARKQEEAAADEKTLTPEVKVATPKEEDLGSTTI